MLLTYSPQPIGDYSYYTIQNNVPTFGKVSFYIDGLYKHTTPTMDLNNNTWPPNQWKVSGEINGAANQMPGGYADGMYFNDLHIWDFNSWKVPASYSVENPYSNWFAVWGGPSPGIGVFDWLCYD